MIGKVVGAVCVMAACGGLGFTFAYKQKKELRLLDQWIRILTRMENEVQYRLRPIADIFRQISYVEKGVLGDFLLRAAVEMDNQIQPDVARCLSAALSSLDGIPDSIVTLAENLGNDLGKYELDGQLRGIERIRLAAGERCNDLNRDKDQRIRGYQTLGLCAGAALVILFI